MPPSTRKIELRHGLVLDPKPSRNSSQKFQSFERSLHELETAIGNQLTMAKLRALLPSWVSPARLDDHQVIHHIAAMVSQGSATLLNWSASHLLHNDLSAVKRQMSVSQEGQDFIKAWEHFSLTVYDANKPKGDWTIGWGHKVESSDVADIVKEQAEKFFREDVSRMAAHVNSDLKVGVTQCQFDALVSLRFNTGANRITPPVSDLNRTGHAIKEDFTKHYITGGGVPMKGLKLRRAAEWQIFSRGVYDATH